MSTFHSHELARERRRVRLAQAAKYRRSHVTKTRRGNSTRDVSSRDC